MKNSILQIFITGILLTLVQSSCVPASTPTPATAIPLSTNTAVPTRQPTATPMPSPASTENVEVATEDSIGSAQATAQSFDAIAAALDQAGYSILEGEVGWLQPEPLEMTADQQNSPMADIRETKPLMFANFVLNIDIDWGQFSEGNVGGCGIAFHAQDLSTFGGEVTLFTTRSQPLVSSWNLEHWNGSSLDSLLGSGVYIDGKFEKGLRSGKNHYLLVVDDLSATVYLNGKQIGSAKLPKGIDNGQVGVFPWAETGSFSCTFTNGWIWKLP